MQGYAYHQDTGELIVAVELLADPMQPGGYLLPAHTTDQPPPAPASGMARVFRPADSMAPGYVPGAGVWELVEDHRGRILYADRAPVEVEALGPLPVGLTEAPRPFDLDELRALKAEEIARARWLAEIGGTVWSTYPVHTDRESQSKASAAYQLARDGFWSPGTVWKFADGIARPLTAADVQALALAVAGHVQAQFARESDRMAQLAAATTEAAVAAVVW